MAGAERERQSLLVRQDQGRFLLLGESRVTRAPGPSRNPALSRCSLLAAQALDDAKRFGAPLDGTDGDGHAVIGVAQRVPSTDWIVVARLDRAEVWANALGATTWIVLAGLAAMFAAAVSAYLMRERQSLRERVELQSRLARISTPCRARYSPPRCAWTAVLHTVREPRARRRGRRESRRPRGRHAAVLRPAPGPRRGLHRAAARGGTLEVPRQAEWRTRHPAGERWLQARATFDREADGVARWHGFVTDVTQRRHAQEALERSEAQYASMVNALREAVLIVALDRRILGSNPAAERVLGIPEGGLMRLDTLLAGRRVVREDGTVFTPEETPIGRAFATGEPQTTRRSACSARPGTCAGSSSTPSRSRGGDGAGPSGVIASFDDITERHEQEPLRKLSLAVEQSPSSIVITDTEGRIEYVNQAFVHAQRLRAGRSQHRPESAHPRSGATPCARPTPSGRRRCSAAKVLQGRVRCCRDGTEYVSGGACVAPTASPTGASRTTSRSRTTSPSTRASWSSSKATATTSRNWSRRAPPSSSPRRTPPRWRTGPRARSSRT